MKININNDIKTTKLKKNLQIEMKLIKQFYSTYIMTFINSNDLNNLVTLRTLNDLKILKDLNALRFTALSS